MSGQIYVFIPLIITIFYPSSVSSSYSSPPWLGAVKKFRPPFFAFPTISSSSLPLHSGGACYGVDLVENEYLFLLPGADLRMDPALRPRPVSSVAFAYLGNALQLDHSIERRCI
jgi:hypothetical protein